MQLPVLDHNTTADKVFGTASTLAQSISESADAGQDMLGAPFQITVFVIAIVYLLFIVRYWDFLRFFIINAAGFHQPNRDKAHISPAEQKNIEVVMIILGVVLSALCVVKVCCVAYPEILSNIGGNEAIWILGGVVTGALGVTIALQYGFTLLVSAICERGDIGRGLISSKLIYLAVGFVTIIPFGILFLLSPTIPATVGFYGMGVCMLTALILFVKETFLFFVSQKISILHWILYLCALEIFPLSLLLAPILR